MKRNLKKNSKFGIYIHWPFCRIKCPYCDYNAHVKTKINKNDWLLAYTNQIKYFSNLIYNKVSLSRNVDSIYFGGGTPSIMEYSMISEIIESINKNFILTQNAEITLEANPSQDEFRNIHLFKDAGINRLSLGIQALNNEDLKFLGRTHSFEEAIKILNISRNIFKNLSVDLLHNLPCQKLKKWKNDLIYFLKNNDIDHLSTYQLSIEDGTKFFKLIKTKAPGLLSNIKNLDFYNATLEVLEKFDLFQYEISNFSKKGFESKHNLLYWESQNWIGIGPGAVSRLWKNCNQRLEIINFENPKTWLEKVLRENKFKSFDVLKSIITEKESLMMGLRLVEGIELTDFNIEILDKFKQINILKKRGILFEEKKKIFIKKKYLNKYDLIINNIIHN